MAINRTINPIVQPTSGFQRSLDTRGNSIVVRKDEQSVPYVVYGNITCFGPGESIPSVQVRFPVHFYQEPTISFSGRVIAGTMSSGNIPSISLCAHAWDIQSNGMYHGAWFLIVLTGPNDLIMDVHWSVTGMAIRRPGGIDASR